jgi:hypothetical protein
VVIADTNRSHMESDQIPTTFHTQYQCELLTAPESGAREKGLLCKKPSALEDRLGPGRY